MWFPGPDLQTDEYEGNQLLPDPSYRDEPKCVVTLSTTDCSSNFYDELFNVVNNFMKLIRKFFSFIFKFINNIKAEEPCNKDNYLSADELKRSTEFLARIAQLSEFKAEIDALKKGKGASKTKANSNEARAIIPTDSEQNKGDDREKGEKEEVQSNKESNRDRESEEVKVTQWSARADAAQAIRRSYTYLKEYLAKIHDTNEEKKITRLEATSLLKPMCKYETSLMTIIWDTTLQRVSATSKSLQSVECELLKGSNLLKSLVNYIQNFRNEFGKVEKEEND
ncbi:DUF5641 domain-containing protein [Trichonephila clavipes]|nr:DUF5641 domain-containing protein [Trichonephila clavipes]